MKNPFSSLQAKNMAAKADMIKNRHAPENLRFLECSCD